MSSTRSVIQNIFATGFTRLATVVLGLAVPIIVARHLGPVSYGYYVSVFSLITLVDFTLETSLLRIAVREVAESPAQAAKLITAASFLRFVVAALGLIACLGVVRFSGYPQEVRTAAYVGSLLLLINAFRTPVALFRANLVIKWELVVTLAARIAEPALVLWFAYTGRGLVYFFLARVVSSFCYAVLAWAVARFRFGLRFDLSRAALARIGSNAVPLGIESLLVFIQLKADIFLVALLAGPVAGGLYGAVAQLAEFSLLAPDVVLTPVFPVLTRSFANSEHQQFSRLYQKTFDLFMVVSLPFAIAFTVYPEVAVRLLFGPKFLDAAPALRGLVWVIVLMYSAGLTGTAAVAINQQRKLARLQVANVLAYLAIDFALIPHWGWRAALLGRIVAVLMGSVLSYRIVRSATGYSLRARTVLLALASGAVMAIALLGLGRFGPLVALAGGALLYVGALWMLHVRVAVPRPEPQ